MDFIDLKTQQLSIKETLDANIQKVWVQPVDPGLFAADLKAIHRDIFHGQANSLASPPQQNAKFKDLTPKTNSLLIA